MPIKQKQNSTFSSAYKKFKNLLSDVKKLAHLEKFNMVILWTFYDSTVDLTELQKKNWKLIIFNL